MQAIESVFAILCILSITINPCYSTQKCQNQETVQDQNRHSSNTMNFSFNCENSNPFSISLFHFTNYVQNLSSAANTSDSASRKCNLKVVICVFKYSGISRLQYSKILLSYTIQRKCTCNYNLLAFRNRGKNCMSLKSFQNV